MAFNVVVGQPTYVERGVIGDYAFSYVVPQGLPSDGAATVVVHFHGSTSHIEDPPSDLDRLYDMQIQELRERNRPLMATDEKTEFIHLYPYRPRDLVSDSYPEFLRDAQAFTKETIVPDLLQPGANSIYARPDEKIANLIVGFSDVLSRPGITAAERVVTLGGSAVGNAANRFTILHPTVVSAACLISAGDFIYPESLWNEKTLRYPFGCSDIGELVDCASSRATLREVPHRLYVGALDSNDPLKYDLYGYNEDAAFVESAFGRGPVARARHYASYLSSIGVPVSLLVLPNQSHRLDLKYVQADAYSWIRRIRWP